MKTPTDREPRPADAQPSPSREPTEAPDSTPAPGTLRQLPGFPLRWRQPGSDLQRLPMVTWFKPGELIVTGFRAMMSTIVGEQSDRRIVQALATRTSDLHDYSVRATGADGPPIPRDGLWIDFLSDTGDGFDPTYTCAYLLAQPELSLAAPDGRTHRLPRADLLVLGGDMVYPAPGRDAYQQRLVAPFETASAGIAVGTAPADPPHVFAVPGNHDWYDGLSAFLRLFCSDVGGRGFAAWRTRQSRSYFALKLPGRWWLVGADIHWVCIFHLGWGAVLLAQWLAPGTGFLQFVLGGVILFCGGWVIGSIVMGLYLLISLNVFGQHAEEAFSAMRIPDYKNFLRIHVAADGTLTIHPIGIERVPRRWREQAPSPTGNPARLAPDEPLAPALIEPPIVLRPTPSAAPPATRATQAPEAARAAPPTARAAPPTAHADRP